MQHLRKIVSAATLALPFAFGMSAAQAQDWPPQSLTLATHSSPGGGGDIMMRNLARTLEEKFGVTTVVDNRVGGSGAVAMSWLATQVEPDGTTLKSVTPTQLLTPLRVEGLPSYEDVTPIARLFLDPTTLYVHDDSPYQTMEEFMDAARADPRGLSIGIGSAGSLDNLVLQNFMRATDLQFRTVPHEGGGDAVVALLGQHIDAVLLNPGQGLSHLEAGTLRILGVFQEERLDAFPDAPTLAELGYPVISNKFRGVFGPPNMDRELLDAIAAVLADIYDDEPWRTYWVESSLNPAFLGPDEFKANLDIANEEFREFLAGLN